MFFQEFPESVLSYSIGTLYFTFLIALHLKNPCFFHYTKLSVFKNAIVIFLPTSELFGISPSKHLADLSNLGFIKLKTGLELNVINRRTLIHAKFDA